MKEGRIQGSPLQRTMDSSMKPAPALEAGLHQITRRHFFSECGVGVGKIALASLLCGSARAAAGAAPSAVPGVLPNPVAPRPPHFAPKAKRVIYLFMAGAPSQ